MHLSREFWKRQRGPASSSSPTSTNRHKEKEMQGNLDTERDRERGDIKETGKGEQKGGQFQSSEIIEHYGKKKALRERKMLKEIEKEDERKRA